MLAFEYEYTDTFGGEANYCWVKRGKVTIPELTYYGFDGQSGYAKVNKIMLRELVKQVKKELGLTGVRCRREEWGDELALYPSNSATVIFIRGEDNA